MQRAIDVTNERRKIQQAYNKQHNITPKSIQRRVTDIMEGAYSAKHGKAKAKIAEKNAQYVVLSPKQLAKKMDALEKQMYQHARDLEFERAAELRDQVEALRKQLEFD